MAFDPALIAHPADDPAVEALRLALQADPANPRSHFDLALALAKRERFAEAEPIFARLVKQFPGMASAQHALGRCRLALGNLAGATSALAAAVHLAPDRADHWLDHGNALLASDRLAEAEAAYRRALALQPGDGRIVANLAGCIARAGRAEEAVELLDQAIATSGDPRLQRNRARLRADYGLDADLADAKPASPLLN